ncbi:hypothetical protein [Paenibacillus sp. FSL H8-0332]|uniref:hypothetical protein n=1 Tax=Paenibacillus sp. FSL H8-0332 TaxID=2954742 RepID=UPI0030CB0489
MTFYSGNLPWDPDKTYDQQTWGTSICSEPEGVTIARQEMLFFFDSFVSMENIVRAAGLDERTIRDAFLHLPVHCKRLEDSSIGYRIEASNMHLPALLMLFMPFY